MGALALGNFGVPVLAAHLFVFYYAVLADLTPPDAVTAFAAANLAGSEPMATGIAAFVLGFAGFLVPFAFILNPGLLLHGGLAQITASFLLTSLSIVCLASAIIGHLFGPLLRVQRLLLFVAAACIIAPGSTLEFIGLGLAGIAFLWSYRNRKFTGTLASEGSINR
jgi:TRAP-type uncharacterized transport system fused permease subunit